MTQASLFEWRDGPGWLVLSGGGDFRSGVTLDIDANVLSYTVSNGPLAYLWASSTTDEAEEYLEYLNDLGGRTAYLLDASTEKDPDTLRQLSEAGIIILGDGPLADRLQDALRGEIVRALESAFADGATIYAQGRLASSLAAWRHAGLYLQPGLSWLVNSVVSAPYDATQMKGWLQDQIPDSYGVGLSEGSALALGGGGEVELWGEQKITVLLGKNLSGG
jgi:hypothetical protein